jgi:hypothetical protein
LREPLINSRNLNFLAGAAIASLVGAASSTHAAPVTWNTDSARSSLLLKINDTPFVVDTLGSSSSHFGGEGFFRAFTPRDLRPTGTLVKIASFARYPRIH